jgi:hypothetical protein
MVNYVDLWLVHTQVVSQLKGAKFSIPVPLSQPIDMSSLLLVHMELVLQTFQLITQNMLMIYFLL